MASKALKDEELEQQEINCDADRKKHERI